MMREDALDKLRDKMTIQLLEATSSDTALQRVRVEEDFNYPAYDPDPASNLRRIQPRDLIKRCVACAALFVVRNSGGAFEKRYCGDRCAAVVEQRAHRARRAAAKGVA